MGKVGYPSPTRPGGPRLLARIVYSIQYSTISLDGAVENKEAIRPPCRKNVVFKGSERRTCMVRFNRVSLGLI